MKLTAYHGTDRELTEITPSYNECGAWFTTSYSNASCYAKGYDAVIYTCELSYNNPLVVDFSEYTNEETFFVNDEEFETSEEIAKYAERNGYDAVYFPVGNFTECDETIVIFNSENIVIK